MDNNVIVMESAADAEKAFFFNLRCEKCWRSNMRRCDGSVKPHRRPSMQGRSRGTGAGLVECVGYERANATKNGAGGFA